MKLCDIFESMKLRDNIDRARKKKGNKKDEENAKLAQADWYDSSKENSPQAPPRNYTGGRNRFPNGR